MALAYRSQAESETAQTPSVVTPAPARTPAPGGLDAWGNAAVCEQVPEVAAPEREAGGAYGGTDAPAWARDDEGEMSAEGTLLRLQEQLAAELAKPGPDGDVVFRLLQQFGRRELMGVRDDRADWAKVQAACEDWQVAALVERIGVFDGMIREDAGVWYALAKLREEVARDIGAKLDAFLSSADLPYGRPVWVPGTQARRRTAELTETTMTEIGMSGDGKPQVSLFQPDFEVVVIDEGLLTKTVRVMPTAAQATVELHQPIAPWELPWAIENIEIAPLVGTIGTREVAWLLG